MLRLRNETLQKIVQGQSLFPFVLSFRHVFYSIIFHFSRLSNLSLPLQHVCMFCVCYVWFSMAGELFRIKHRTMTHFCLFKHRQDYNNCSSQMPITYRNLHKFYLVVHLFILSLSASKESDYLFIYLLTYYYYRAMHVVLARYCYRKSSVHSSVCL